MPQFTRRTFLSSAVSAALLSRAAGPAFAAVPREADIVIIGAGAAGIAAARRVRDAGRKAVVIEAGERVGGRCFTDTDTFGVPFDRGAFRLHQPDANPLARLARSVNAEINPASSGQRIWIGRRHARPGEVEDFLTSIVRAGRAIEQRPVGKIDVAAASLLPADLGDWRPSAEFVLGPLVCGKDLNAVSAEDYASTPRRVSAALCRQGFGTLLSRLAADLPISLRTRAQRVDWGARSVAVDTDAGRIACRAVILTVSTAVLASGRIAFTPDLPKRQRDAAGALTLGAHERVMFDIPGNPFDLGRDDSIIEKAADRRTAALQARIGGSDLYAVDIAGSIASELGARSEAELVAFARDWLSRLFGTEGVRRIARSAATRWSADPLIGGSCAVASVGNAFARKALAEPLGPLLFAGEAVHESQWGTVNGAWESGERAADLALRRIGAIKEPETAPPAPRKKPRRPRD